MSNEPSSDGSVTQPTDMPVTGTPATESATPQKPALTLEEVLKRNAELEHSHKNAREQADRQAKMLEKYQKQEKETEAAKKAAQDAELSELERTKKQYADLQAEHNTYTHAMQERMVRYEVQAQAAKLGIIDPELAMLAVQNDLEYGEDGMPTNTDKALEKLIKNKPYLAPVKQEAQSSEPVTPPARGAPTIPAMNPGRSSIAAPGSIPPGRIPRLSDPGVLVPPGTVSKYQP